MILFSIAFLLGACGILYFTAVPNLTLLGMIWLVSLLLLLSKRHVITGILFAMICGLCWVMLWAHARIQQAFPTSLEGKNIQIQGKIISLPIAEPHETSFLFKTTENRLLKLTWYHADLLLKAGDQWRLTVRLKQPHGFANPGSFDQEAYLFEQNISAIGYVVNAKYLGTQKISINRLRQALQDQLIKRIQGQSAWEFLPALIMGSREFVTENEWDVLRKTGTNHLIAIAGLHIGLIAAVFYFLVNFLWRRMAFLTLRIPAQIAASVASLLAASFYSLLAGFPVQTQRALIMLSVVLLAVIFKRRILSWQGFCLALLLVLISNPFNVMTMSFWMSFFVVAMIIYGNAGRLSIKTKYHHLVKIQFLITLAVLPFSLWFFNQFSIIAPFANLIAVPWFALIIMPLCFLDAILLMIKTSWANLFLSITLKNLQLLWWLLEKLSQLPVINFHWAVNDMTTLFFLIIAIILFLSPKGFPGRYLAVFFILPLFITPPLLQNGEVKLSLLDVGQGLSAIIQTAHHTLIYDTGPRFTPTFDAGTAVIIPYLQHENISTIDLMMVSHGDMDHIGGAKSILANLKVNKILTSVPNYFSKNSAQNCYQGQHWIWEGIIFDVLSPKKNEPYADNNSSCVLRVTIGQQHILLTGDIEKEREQFLENQPLSSTILIAPHHGSNTSSTMPFILQVHPKYVLFPVGYRNRFHFPDKRVQKRYGMISAIQYDTAQMGAIQFLCSNRSQNLQPMLYRKNHRHLWSFSLKKKEKAC